MNHVVKCVLARLECYRDYSSFTIKNFKYPKPSGLNIKVIDDVVRIKLKRDCFVHIEGYDIFLVDTIVPNGDAVSRVPKIRIATFKDAHSCMEWMQKLIADPSIALKVVVSRLDPTIPCKMYMVMDNGTKKYIRVNGKHANAINASQIAEFKSEGVIFEMGAKVEDTHQIRIGAKKKVNSYNNSKANNGNMNLTQRFKR